MRVPYGTPPPIPRTVLSLANGAEKAHCLRGYARKPVDRPFVRMDEFLSLTAASLRSR